jgi:hypothetical protein
MVRASAMSSTEACRLCHSRTVLEGTAHPLLEEGKTLALEALSFLDANERDDVMTKVGGISGFCPLCHEFFLEKEGY